MRCVSASRASRASSARCSRTCAVRRSVSPTGLDSLDEDVAAVRNGAPSARPAGRSPAEASPRPSHPTRRRPRRSTKEPRADGEEAQNARLVALNMALNGARRATRPNAISPRTSPSRTRRGCSTTYTPSAASSGRGRGAANCGLEGGNTVRPRKLNTMGSSRSSTGRGDQLVVTGAREHNLKDIDVAIPRDALVVITGLSRLGQVLPGVRHDLRRGPAPLRRVALRLRAAVPRARWTSPTSTRSRAFAGDLHRPEDDLAQPALHRRHGDGDLRLPAPAVGARSASRTAPSAAGRSRGSRPSRSSTRSWSWPRARASWCSRRSCAGERASTASCSRSCAREASRASRRRRAADARRGRSSSTRSYKHDHRGGRRPAGHARRTSRKRLADSIETAVAPRRGHGRDRVVVTRESDGGAPRPMLFSRALRVPGARPRRSPSSSRGSSRSTRPTARARAAPGWARRWRSTPISWSRTRRSRSARARSCRGPDTRPTTTRDHRRRSPSATRSTSTTPVGGAAGRPARPVSARHQRRPHPHQLPQPLRGAGAPTRRLRGHRPQPRAPLPRDRLRVVREKIEEYMSVRPCPDCRGRVCGPSRAR